MPDYKEMYLIMVRAAEQAQAATEDDEDEDDWRKYL